MPVDHVSLQTHNVAFAVTFKEHLNFKQFMYYTTYVSDLRDLTNKKNDYTCKRRTSRRNLRQIENRLEEFI